MTEENSTPNQDPKNLLNFGLDAQKYDLCGGIQDASLFYNINRWTCSTSSTFDVTPNIGPGGGPRKVTVGVLIPKNPQTDPIVLAATSHWCVPWGQSTCEIATPEAHDNDAKIFSLTLENLMKQYPTALVVFGGDLNSMSPPESDHLVEKMKSYGYPTANPYEDKKLKPTMGGTPDLIFYKKVSENSKNTLALTQSFINPMLHNNVPLSDHWGAVIAKFTYSLTE